MYLEYSFGCKCQVKRKVYSFRVKQINLGI